MKLEYKIDESDDDNRPNHGTHLSEAEEKKMNDKISYENYVKESLFDKKKFEEMKCYVFH